MSEDSFELNTIVDDAKFVITDPIEFFRQMPTTGGYKDPIIFVVALAVIAGFIVSIITMVGLGPHGFKAAGGISFGLIIFFPIIAVIGSFIGAAIMFVIWKLMGSDKGYETAYRCVAYSMAIAPIIAVLLIIPFIAGIIKVLWSCFLMYAASIEVHKVEQQTAKIVFGILAGIGLLSNITIT